MGQPKKFTMNYNVDVISKVINSIAHFILFLCYSVFVLDPEKRDYCVDLRADPTTTKTTIPGWAKSYDSTINEFFSSIIRRR